MNVGLFQDEGSNPSGSTKLSYLGCNYYKNNKIYPLK